MIDGNQPNKGDIMTYYWKKAGSDAYHWHKDCSLNKYPAEGWTSASQPPTGREKCNQCKAKDAKK
jgi:hypothetical protein